MIRHLIVVCSLHNVFIAAFLMKMVHGCISNFLVCLVLWRQYKTAQACNESQKYTYIQPIQDTRHTSTPTHQQAQHTHKDCWNMSDKIKQYVLKAKQNMYKWWHFRMFCTKQHPFPRRGGSHPNFLQILHFQCF